MWTKIFPKINYRASRFDPGIDFKESCKSSAESDSSLASGRIDYDFSWVIEPVVLNAISLTMFSSVRDGRLSGSLYSSLSFSLESSLTTVRCPYVL